MMENKYTQTARAPHVGNYLMDWLLVETGKFTSFTSLKKGVNYVREGFIYLDGAV